MVLNPAIYGMGAWWFERSLWLMTLLTADRKVLCKAGEQAGGPDRCSPAPLLKTAFYSPQTRILRVPNVFGLALFDPVLFGLVLFILVLFGYRALAELDGPLRLG